VGNQGAAIDPFRTVAPRPSASAAVLAILVGLLVVPTVARAQEGPEATLHGFGGDAYGNAGHNRYTAGAPGGEYGNAQLALVAIANPYDRLQISAQVFWKQAAEGAATELDYAFAEWRFSDSLRLRAGRAKQPFGIYTETFDVGTLRPFYSLPQGVYGPAALVAKGYDGIGLTGRATLGRGFALDYDVYGGGVRLDSTALAPSPGEAEAEAEVEIIRDTVGGRLSLEAPVAGLSFGVSFYSGKEQRDVSVRHTVYGVHGEYLAGPWSLRSEYIFHPEVDGPHLKAFYLEAARRFGPHWQGAARYDWSDTVFSSGQELPERSLGRHKDAALGLNYWFSPGFVLKLSYHHVNGNRFARPEDLEATLDAGRLEARTNLVVFGAQFSF
jgi:hypothetical protein